MSSVLAWPLIIAVSLCVYIVLRASSDWVKFGAAVEGATFVIFGLAVYFPSTFSGISPSWFLALAGRLNDFAEALIGRGWYWELWVICVFVDVVITTTGTHLPLARRLRWVLHGLVVLGLGWILYGFVSGNPVQGAFG